MIRKRTFLKRVFSLFKPFWGPFGIVIFLMILTQASNAFAPYLFGRSVDAVTSGDVQKTIFFLGTSFILTLIYGIMISWISDIIEIKRLGDYIQKHFAVHSIEKMFSFSIGQHINEHSGVKQSIVNKGQQALSNMMFTLLYSILPVVIQVLVTGGILFFIDWKIGVVAFSFVAMFIVINFYRNKKFFPTVSEMRKREQNLGKLQSELYRNSTLVIAEAQEDKTRDIFSQTAEETVIFKNLNWLKFIRSYYGSKLLIFGGQYVTLGYGVYLIFTGSHSVGMFVTLFSWTGAIFSNLGFVMRMQRQLLFQKAEIEKYFELLDIQPDIDPNLNGVIIKTFSGEIEFRNVSFAYPYRKSIREIEAEDFSDKKEEHAIENVSFKIPAGAKVGFVGVSGSGKSTLVNLMRRFYDVIEGEILIDGINIKKLDLHWLRSQIGNVEQKIDLFDRSIRDNILFGLPAGSEISEEKLSQVIKDASLDDFVTKLKEHGLDTVIGEGGIKVSGGERQRIGIARALIKDPKILIFDEATSALDSINEKLIHEAINRSAKGRTTIMIAHRLSTVMDADIIFVVHEGKIVDSGTHKELKARCPEYQELIKNQIF